jgi:hypothetical protein
MGRPIKSQYFGRNNTDGVGGEALYSNGSGNVTLSFTGNLGFGYYAGNVAATFTAPSIAGGTTAVSDAVYLHANGAIKAVHISSGGTGYVTPATLTFTGGNVRQPDAVTANIVPVTTTANAINANAWTVTGTVGKAADIVKQVGSRRYRVTNADGTSNCRLVTTANPAAAGEMTITATFADGTSTFSVAKMTDHLVYDDAGNDYIWNDQSSTSGPVTFATASNSTTPPTVSISSL